MARDCPKPPRSDSKVGKGGSKGGRRVNALEETADDEEAIIEEEVEDFVGALTLAPAQPIMVNACSKPEKSKNGWTKVEVGVDSLCSS